MSRLDLVEHRVPPPVLVLLAGAVQRRLPARATRPVRRVLAGAVAVVSLGLAADAERHFRAAGTTVNPLSPERASSLVTGGVFGLTRNPMYVAMGGALLARAVHRGHPLQLLPAAAWVAFIDRFQVRPEERALEQVFGEQYDAYRARVRRWL